MTFVTFYQSDEGTLQDQKKTMTKTNTETKTMTETNTFREHIQRATLETCDLLRHLIRVMRRNDLTKKIPTLDPPTYLPIRCTSIREQSYRLVTFETFDQSDERT